MTRDESGTGISQEEDEKLKIFINPTIPHLKPSHYLHHFRNVQNTDSL
jgi:hypothetical protein